MTNTKRSALRTMPFFPLLCVLLAAAALAMPAAGQIPLMASGVNVKVSYLSQSPDPVEPGQTLELRWKVENEGSRRAEDALFEILPEYPLSLEPGASPSKDIGSLSASQTGEEAVTLFYKLRVDSGAVPADVKIHLRYSLDGGQNWVQAEAYTIRIAAHTAILAVQDVRVVPERLVPGKTAEVTMTLRNNADIMLENIKVKLNFVTVIQTAGAIQYKELPFTAVSSSNEKDVPLLRPGEKALVNFTLMVDGDAKSAVYKVPLSLTYLDKEGKVYATDSATTFLGLVVAAPPAYDLQLKDRKVYIPGSSGDIVFSVSNIGPSEIKYLTLELLDGEHYRVLSPPSSYLGNLESDDFETAEHTIHIDREAADAGRTLPLQIRLRYKDSFNAEATDLRVITLPLYTSGEARELGLIPGRSQLPFVLLAALVLGGIAYYLLRRRRK